MRTMVATLAGLMALAAIAVQASPLPPVKTTITELNVVPPVELVRQGCGWGWHRHHWRDSWGYWHWGHCVPNW